MVEKSGHEPTSIEAVKAKREEYAACAKDERSAGRLGFLGSAAGAFIVGLSWFSERKTGVKMEVETADAIFQFQNTMAALGMSVIGTTVAMGTHSFSRASDFSRRGAALEQALAHHTLATGELDAISDSQPASDESPKPE